MPEFLPASLYLIFENALPANMDNYLCKDGEEYFISKNTLKLQFAKRVSVDVGDT